MKDASFLDDMLAPVSQLGQQVESSFKSLPLDQIDLDANQPRKHMDEAALQEMADSILQYGILQPVTVTLQDGRYCIVTGERRYRAALQARDRGEPCTKTGYDLSCIPALVVDALDEVTRLEQQLVENLAREDMSPVDTGRAFQQILDKTGESASALARRVGKSAAWVRQILAFAQPELLPKLERLGVDSAEVPVALAQSLLTCSEEDLDWMQAQIADGQKLDRELLDAAVSRAEDDQMIAEPEPEPEAHQEETPPSTVALEDEAVEASSVETDDDDEPEYGECFGGPAGPAGEGEESEGCSGSPAESAYVDTSDDDAPEYGECFGPAGEPGEHGTPEYGAERFVDRVSPPVSVHAQDCTTHEAVESTTGDRMVTITLTLPDSVWRAFLDKAGVMGAVNADTVQQAIDALSS